MVHKPGLAVARLTPPNCAKVLFDDVIWVKQARSARMTVVAATLNQAVGVMFLRPMLAVTLSGLATRRWLLSARITDNTWPNHPAAHQAHVFFFSAARQTIP